MLNACQGLTEALFELSLRPNFDRRRRGKLEMEKPFCPEVIPVISAHISLAVQVMWLLLSLGRDGNIPIGREATSGDEGSEEMHIGPPPPPLHCAHLQRTWFCVCTFIRCPGVCCPLSASPVPES